MPSFRELLASTKAQIREVDTAETEAARVRTGTMILDVREPEAPHSSTLAIMYHVVE